MMLWNSILPRLTQGIGLNLSLNTQSMPEKVVVVSDVAIGLQLHSPRGRALDRTPERLREPMSF